MSLPKKPRRDLSAYKLHDHGVTRKKGIEDCRDASQFDPEKHVWRSRHGEPVIVDKQVLRWRRSRVLKLKREKELLERNRRKLERIKAKEEAAALAKNPLLKKNIFE